MKKIAGLILAIVTASTALAQQKAKQKHMVITVSDLQTGHANNVIITRDDTAQVQQYVKLKGKTADRETQLMEITEPYYNNGWKLVSTSAEFLPAAIVPTEELRFYLVKEN